MFTIYSQRNTVHVNKISSRFFQITTLQNCKQGTTDAVVNTSAKDKLTRHVRFEISKKDNTI